MALTRSKASNAYVPLAVSQVASAVARAFGSDKPDKSDFIPMSDAIRSENTELNSGISRQPFTLMDDHLVGKSKGWQIKESLLFSFHFGQPTMTSEDFIKLKADFFISALLIEPSVQFSVKKERGQQFLGKW